MQEFSSGQQKNAQEIAACSKNSVLDNTKLISATKPPSQISQLDTPWKA
jgi:hypothetical protein